MTFHSFGLAGLVLMTSASAAEPEFKGGSVALLLSNDQDLGSKATFSFQSNFKPTSGDPDSGILRNEDGSITACCVCPATKTGHIWLFVKLANGDLKVMQDLNRRLADLFGKKPPANFALDCVMLEAIHGREISLVTSYYSADLPPLPFKVRVDEDGGLHLIHDKKER